jgi:hypothetical protein
MAGTVVNILNSKKKNYLLNGAFDFAQRGASSTSSGVYVLDRWFVENSFPSINTQKLTTAGEGTPNLLRMSAVTATSGTYRVLQPLETAEVLELAGKTITFSCFMLVDSTLQAGGNIELQATWGTGTDERIPTGGATLTQAIDPATLDTVNFQQVSGTFVIPSNATSLNVSIFMDSTVANGSDLDVKNCMLTIGESAVLFSRAGDNVGEEGSLCQRYYSKTYALETTPGTNTLVGSIRKRNASTGNTISGSLHQYWKFPVTMRSIPTAIIRSSVTGATGNMRNENGGVDTTATAGFSGDQGVNAANTGAAIVGDTYSWHITADAEL